MESMQRPVSIEEIATKAMGASRPVIGIVPTYDPNEGILRMNNHYAQAVVAAGGAPLIVPFTSDVSVYESLLPHIDLIPPKNVIGRNTIDAMDSGMIYGTASMLDGMSDRIQEELGQPVQVIATGGLSQKVTPYCRHTITQDPNLLLKGLRILYYKNIK